MAQEHLILGTPNGQNGEFVREAFTKTENNFTELYNFLPNYGLDNQIPFMNDTNDNFTYGNFTFDGNSFAVLGTGTFTLGDFDQNGHSNYLIIDNQGLKFNSSGGEFISEGADFIVNAGNAFLNGSVRIGNAYTLPDIDGTLNQILKTNGSGVITWEDENNVSTEVGVTITDTGTTIPITTTKGTNCNFEDINVNNNVNFTLTSLDIINSWAQVRINTITEPVLTHATKSVEQVSGIPWAANTDLYINVRDLGISGFQYSYLPKEVNVGIEYIPLTGTTLGNPVTGAVDFNAGINLNYSNMVLASGSIIADGIKMNSVGFSAISSLGTNQGTATLSAGYSANIESGSTDGLGGHLMLRNHDNIYNSYLFAPLVSTNNHGNYLPDSSGILVNSIINSDNALPPAVANSEGQIDISSIVSSVIGIDRTPIIVATDTYTFLEADILASKTYLFTNNVASSIIVTVPPITKPNTDLIEIKMRSVSEVPIEIIPDVTLPQISFTPRILGEVFSIASTDDDVWMKWQNVNQAVYVIPPLPLGINIILNSTLDDASNISIEAAAYTVSGGTLNFLDTEDNRETTFTTSEAIVAGDYQLGFDITASGGTNIFAVLVDGVTVISGTTYPSTTGQTVDFTYVGVDAPNIQVQGVSSGGGTTWSIDNITLRKYV